MPQKSFRPYTKEELQALEALLRAGFPLVKAAKVFGLRSVNTLKAHAKKQPELKALVEHGLSTSVANVANALYLKATGYDFTEDTYDVVGEDENGEPIMKLKKRVTKKVHPDVLAANAFLNNRAPDLWKSKREEPESKAPKTLFITINGSSSTQLPEKKKEIEADYEVVDGKH